jgi:hypothetical protein
MNLRSSAKHIAATLALTAGILAGNAGLAAASTTPPTGFGSGNPYCPPSFCYSPPSWTVTPASVN